MDAVPALRFYRNDVQIHEQLETMDRETLDNHIARPLYD